jgi:hypothetical protein
MFLLGCKRQIVCNEGYVRSCDIYLLGGIHRLNQLWWRQHCLVGQENDAQYLGRQLQSPHLLECLPCAAAPPSCARAQGTAPAQRRKKDSPVRICPRLFLVSSGIAIRSLPESSKRCDFSNVERNSMILYRMGLALLRRCKACPKTR